MSGSISELHASQRTYGIFQENPQREVPDSFCFKLLPRCDDHRVKQLGHFGALEQYKDAG